MQINKQIHKLAKKEIKRLGFYPFAQGSSLNYRTVVRIHDKGVCLRGSYLKLIAFLKKEAKNTQKTISTLIDQEND